MQLRDVVLTLLDQPASGWDLAARLEQVLPRLVSARPSQLYPVLHRLEAQGLVASHDEPSRRGPPRRVHTLTDAGRERVAAVLASPPRAAGGRRPELAQLCLLDRLEDADAAREVLLTLRARWQADLAATRHDLAALDPAPGPAPDAPDPAPDPRRHARLGLRILEAELEGRLALLDEALGADDEAPAPR